MFCLCALIFFVFLFYDFKSEKTLVDVYLQPKLEKKTIEYFIFKEIENTFNRKDQYK